MVSNDEWIASKGVVPTGANVSFKTEGAVLPLPNRVTINLSQAAFGDTCVSDWPARNVAPAAGVRSTAICSIGAPSPVVTVMSSRRAIKESPVASAVT